jgi:hypothetical protein
MFMGNYKWLVYHTAIYEKPDIPALQHRPGKALKNVIECFQRCFTVVFAQ